MALNPRALWALCSLLFIVAPIRAADAWVKVSSPRFEVLTSAGEKKGREALRQLEQVRSFYLQVNPSRQMPTLPVRVIAFRNEKEYRPYAPNEKAAAFYVGGEERDTIVMREVSAESFPIAIHEYTHLVIKHSGIRMPLWLNEGHAELFSTLKPLGGKILVGELIPGRVHELRQGKWIDLPTLMAVDHNSPLYNEKNRGGLLYAESWALTHMLALGDSYRPNFPKFLEAIHGGVPGPEALQQAFGRPAAVVYKDLENYFNSYLLKGALFDAKLEKSAEEPAVQPATSLEVDLALAELLAMVRKPTEAKARYEQLAQAHPDSAEVHRGLGFLAWRAGDRDGAVRHFGLAVEKRIPDAKLHLTYAQMLQGTQGTGPKQVAALQRAMELQPDLPNVQRFLGFALLNEQRFPDALAALRKVKRVTPDEAVAFFRAMAYAAERSGDELEARSAAKRAREFAKTPQEISDTETLLRYFAEKDRLEAASRTRAASPGEEDRPYLARREAPVSTFAVEQHGEVREHHEGSRKVVGTLERVDCPGNEARLVVSIEGRKQIFAVKDPGSVEIRGVGGATVDFTCGVQKPKLVTLEVGPANVVRMIQFGAP